MFLFERIIRPFEFGGMTSLIWSGGKINWRPDKSHDSREEQKTI